MKLAKSLLLGSAAALVATAGATAADLPSKKAAPVQYVQVCSAYGAGFFTIPGTDTCLKIGGRVRADYAMSGTKDIFSSNASTAANELAASQSLYGFEARGRVELDARTPTAYGTVQAVTSLRVARTAGVLAVSGPNSSAGTASPTLEAAYMRFAGFTFGVARDNFAFMPSVMYGAGHWGSFANGANQLAYTAVLGGGLTATLAIQDRSYTTAGGLAEISGTIASGYAAAVNSYYRGMPQINARLDWDQSWGSLSLTAAVGEGRMVTSVSATTYNESKTVWAIGAGVKLDLPMLAKGDQLFLTAAYADGMTEYTTNWASFKSSDTARNVGGNVIGVHPSWVAGANGLETVKSWNVAAILTHFWTPQWRSAFMGSYGQIQAPTSAKALNFGTTGAASAGGFGDATVWNIGKQIAFLPTRNFEIGVEALYARVSQDVNDAGVVARRTDGNWTGRLRVERTF